MLLNWLVVTALAAACAPTAAPSTLAAVAKVESGFDPLAIGVNGPSGRQLHPATRAEAAATARRLIASGFSVDLGLAQINSANLGRLGLSIEHAFDACANLEASGRVLQAAYVRTLTRSNGPGVATLQALSIYNTGRPDRGFANGYVAKVAAAATGMADPPTAPRPPRTAPAAWDVFGQSAAATAFVFSPAATENTP
jgi:type IV secretion system protein VirB1